MTGATLLEDLTGRGVKLWAEGDELRCRGPKKTLTREVLAQLKEHKAEIVGLLARHGVPRRDASEPLGMGARLRRIRDERRARGGAVAAPVNRRTDKEEFYKGNWREAWPRDFKAHEGGSPHSSRTT
jgi:TubC N-terminal docking domain